MGDVFLKLLNMSITAGWIVLAAILFRIVFKNAPKWIRCALWAMVALRLILPFSFELGLSAVPSTGTVQMKNERLEGTGYFIDGDTGEKSFVESEKIVIDSGIKSVDNLINPIIHRGGSSVPIGIAEGKDADFADTLGVIWAVGLAVMLLYAVSSYLMLRKKVGASVKEGDVMLCDGISSPFILGIFRPKIYLPSKTAPEIRPYITAHEKAHLKRKDYLWKPLGFLLLSVYWFNPVMWLAYILLCRDIELACDEKVIRDYDIQSRADYSQALLDCSMVRRAVSACPLAFGETGVKERVKKVLDYKKPAFWLILLAVITCAAAAVFLLTDPKPEKEPADVTETGCEAFDIISKGRYTLKLRYENFGDILISRSGSSTVIAPLESFTGEDTDTYLLFCDGVGYYIDRKTGAFTEVNNNLYSFLYQKALTGRQLSKVFSLKSVEEDEKTKKYAYETEDGENTVVFTYEEGIFTKIGLGDGALSQAFTVLSLSDSVTEDYAFTITDEMKKSTLEMLKKEHYEYFNPDDFANDACVYFTVNSDSRFGFIILPVTYETYDTEFVGGYATVGPEEMKLIISEWTKYMPPINIMVIPVDPNGDGKEFLPETLENVKQELGEGYNYFNEFHSPNELATDLTDYYEPSFVKAMFGELLELDASEGLNVFVWQYGEWSYRCCVMDNVTYDKWIPVGKITEQRSLRIGQMKVILDSYPIPGKMITVYPFVNPKSKFQPSSTITAEKLKELFEKDYDYFPSYYEWHPEENEKTGEEKLEELRDKYPGYFTLDASDGIDVFVYQAGADSFRCCLAKREDPSGRSAVELSMLPLVSVYEARLILDSYGIPDGKITVYPFVNPVSSYLPTDGHPSPETLKTMFGRDYVYSASVIRI